MIDFSDWEGGPRTKKNGQEKTVRPDKTIFFFFVILAGLSFLFGRFFFVWAGLLFCACFGPAELDSGSEF